MYWNMSNAALLFSAAWINSNMRCIETTYVDALKQAGKINSNMRCIETIFRIYLFPAAYRLIVTWDVLKLVYSGTRERVPQRINSNMRCIETKYTTLKKSAKID